MWPTPKNAKPIIVIANSYITPTYVPETVLRILNVINPYKNSVRGSKGNWADEIWGFKKIHLDQHQY